MGFGRDFRVKRLVRADVTGGEESVFEFGSKGIALLKSEEVECVRKNVCLFGRET